MFAASANSAESIQFPDWAGWLLIFATGALMAYWTWGAWPDVVIDFGRELYVAWRLTEGDVLYRDLAYFNGPLSPYINMIWFRLFGVGLRTLVLCNLFLLACFVVLLYQMLNDISDRTSAVLGSVVFLLIFAFLQLLTVGNFNFITPYSHETTHGIMLAFASLYCLWGYDRNGSVRLLAISGLALGLVTLTKVELFVGALVTDFVFLIMLAIDRKSGFAETARCFLIFTSAGLAPLMGSVFLLSMAMPFPEAVSATSGAWINALNQEVTTMYFYRHGMGLVRPAENLLDLLIWFAWYIAILGPAVWIGLSRRLSAGRKMVFGIGWAAIISCAIIFRADQISWLTAFRPLPLMMMIALAALGIRWLYRRNPTAEQRSIARLFSIFVLALVLLGKMLLNVRLYQYGFFLAMPATILTIIILLFWLPKILAALGGAGFPVRMTGAAVITLTISVYLLIADTAYQRLMDTVGHGGDEFRADYRGPMTNRILEHIETHVDPRKTLTVLPEGVMLNYLSRRSSSIPYFTFIPPEMAMFGEDTILESLQDEPPDFIVIVHRDTSTYGYRYRFFGVHYGQKMMAWARKNYRVIEQVGATPLESSEFGMQLLARKW